MLFSFARFVLLFTQSPVAVDDPVLERDGQTVVCIVLDNWLVETKVFAFSSQLFSVPVCVQRSRLTMIAFSCARFGTQNIVISEHFVLVNQTGHKLLAWSACCRDVSFVLCNKNSRFLNLSPAIHISLRLIPISRHLKYLCYMQWQERDEWIDLMTFLSVNSKYTWTIWRRMSMEG